MNKYRSTFVIITLHHLSLLTEIGGAVNVSPNPKYSFEQCLVTNPSLGYCVGVSALAKLQSFDNDAEFDIVDGVSFTRDDQQPRTLYNFLERDPNDLGGIMDTMSNVIAYRTIRWDMSTLYPGLEMRVTPSVNGVLEFVMDPNQDELQLKNHYKQIGTARIMARQFLLPVLLGFKFKVATLIPIMFGIIALLAKKALIISKIALVLSSSLALGSILMGSYGGGFPSNHHQQQHHGNGYEHHGFNSWNNNQHGGYKSEDDSLGDYGDIQYKGYTNNAPSDQIQFAQGNLQEVFERKNVPGRNFAWNNAEKQIKV